MPNQTHAFCTLLKESECQFILYDIPSIASSCIAAGMACAANIKHETTLAASINKAATLEEIRNKPRPNKPRSLYARRTSKHSASPSAASTSTIAKQKEDNEVVPPPPPPRWSKHSQQHSV